MFHRLSSLGVGCHFGGQFVGGIAYADDVTLLAPTPSALRTLLKEAQLFAAEFKLTFNATKTQLVCFRSSKSKIHLSSDTFLLDGHPLHFSDTATHLSHLLYYNLDDTDDVARVCSELCRKLIASHTHLVAVVLLFRISLSLPIAFPYLAPSCGALIVEKSKLLMLHLTTC